MILKMSPATCRPFTPLLVYNWIFELIFSVVTAEGVHHVLQLLWSITQMFMERISVEIHRMLMIILRNIVGAQGTIYTYILLPVWRSNTIDILYMKTQIDIHELAACIRFV